MIDVGCASEFPEGAVTVRQAGKQEIGVIRWQGRLYAVRNVCPHQLAPVCRGRLRPLLVADEQGTAEPACDGDQPVLSCPWHGWEFDVRTGRACWNHQFRLRTYPIEVHDGRVLVDVARHADGSGAGVGEQSPGTGAAA